MNQSKTLEKTTLQITLCGLFVALTYVATAFVNVRIPFLAANGGLIHLGNIPVFVAAALFGKRCGALAGALGMAIFDITCGWVSWAPFTFVICGLIGYTFAWITYERINKVSLVSAVAAAVVIKVIGYYITEAILYQNLIVPLTSIPGNVVQILVAGIVAVPVILTLRYTVRNLVFA